MRRSPVTVIGAAALAAVLVAGGVGIGALGRAGAGAPSSGSAVAGGDSGPIRLLTGRAYAEYLAAQRPLGPLPAGSSWPLGVPPQGGYGAVGGGLLRPGSGTDTAYFTYLCAWESDYLAARAVDEASRADRARGAIARFFDSAWARRISPDGVWAAAVSLPLLTGNDAGVQYDRPDTCRRAGITLPPTRIAAEGEAAAGRLGALSAST
ncbi:MAG: hypothetical protein HY996_00160 [Micrococcales bacterium]|nr:hypothetical protein [Micrococcales bacterium]